MLLRTATLRAIADGAVTLAFRRWKRPTVRTGGTLTTAIGVLRIEDVSRVDPAAIPDADARRAGYADADSLRTELDRRPDGDAYRIAFHLAGPDPRIALREDLPDEAEIRKIRARLQRWDRAGPWTTRVLRLIADRPAVRAGDLADALGMERLPFKANVRKLKGLGLTESLEVGYRLSARGVAVLAQLERGGA